MYKDNFEKIWEELSNEDVDKLIQLRDAELENIFEKQFVLSYGTHLTKADTDKMSLYELDKFVDLLITQKTKEADRAESG